MGQLIYQQITYSITSPIMKVTHQQINGFMHCLKVVTKYIMQDKEAMKTIPNTKQISYQLEQQFRKHFDFYKHYKYARTIRAQELNKINDRHTSNQILQKEDQAFWETLPEEQVKLVHNLAEQNPVVFYCVELRNLIPQQILEQINSQIESIPTPPAGYFEYFIKKVKLNME